MFFSPLFFTSTLLFLSSCCFPKHALSFSLDQGAGGETSSQLLQPSNWNTVSGDLLSSSSHSHVHTHKDIRGGGGGGDTGAGIYGESGQPLTMDQFNRNSPVPLSVTIGEHLKKALFKSAGVSGVPGATPPQEFSVAGMLKMTPIREPTCNETIGRMFTAICGNGNGKESFKNEGGFPTGSLDIPIQGSSASGPQGFFHQHTSESGGYRQKRSSVYSESSFIRSLLGKRSPLLSSEDYRIQTELLMSRCCSQEDQVQCSITEVGRQLQDLCKPNRHGSRAVLNA